MIVTCVNALKLGHRTSLLNHHCLDIAKRLLAKSGGHVMSRVMKYALTVHGLKMSLKMTSAFQCHSESEST